MLVAHAHNGVGFDSNYGTRLCVMADQIASMAIAIINSRIEYKMLEHQYDGHVCVIQSMLSNEACLNAFLPLLIEWLIVPPRVPRQGRAYCYRPPIPVPKHTLHMFKV